MSVVVIASADVDFDTSGVADDEGNVVAAGTVVFLSIVTIVVPVCGTDVSVTLRVDDGIAPEVVGTLLIMTFCGSITSHTILLLLNFSNVSHITEHAKHPRTRPKIPVMTGGAHLFDLKQRNPRVLYLRSCFFVLCFVFGNALSLSSVPVGMQLKYTDRSVSSVTLCFGFFLIMESRLS